jgi:7-cyano-7-deazaguanine synthase
MNRRAVVLLSGGQDSTTVLFYALAAANQGDKFYCLTIDYGQRHKIEIAAAHKVVAMARQYYPDLIEEHEVLHLGSGILQATSPLVSGNELEQYENWDKLPGGLEKTFVPLRNQLFLTLAANRAAAFRADRLFIGVSQEDYGGYPDCRYSFISALQASVNEGLGDGKMGFPRLWIMAPLMHLSKCATVQLAARVKGCFEALAYSHTAYDGQYPPVGHDHATLLRAKGFAEAGFADPLVVRAHKEGLMDLPDTPNYDDFREAVGPQA